ncbi:MAG: hypothetical protein EU539_11400 [Promethearchaeota archaeon]|nr:MAG: hypothetical protein EU539_11400 [Candidatus Lokiarchaeota archaeon]
MGLYRKILAFKSRIYDNYLIKPSIVKKSIITALIIFSTSIILGFIVAQFDPDGYNIVDNWISDMGSFNHTPLPYFLDFGAMITSILIIPAIYYMEDRLAPNPTGDSEFPRMRYRLSSLGFFFMFMGFFGFFNVGLFSEDRTTALGLHMFFSYIVFSGLVFSSVFYGLLITFYKTEIPKIIGIYAIFVPFIVAYLALQFFNPLFEWILLFSLLIWMFPVFLIFAKNIHEAEKANK